MEIHFFKCQRINPDRDGLDLVYFYRINDDPQIHRIHTVTRHSAAWSINQSELLEHSRRVFHSLLLAVVNLWKSNRTLPEDDREYHDGIHINTVTDKETDWDGYTLEIEEG